MSQHHSNLSTLRIPTYVMCWVVLTYAMMLGRFPRSQRLGFGLILRAMSRSSQGTQSKGEKKGGWQDQLHSGSNPRLLVYAGRMFRVFKVAKEGQGESTV